MRSRIDEIRGHIGQNDVVLVAVTKGRTVDEILQAYSYGIRDFGESYVGQFPLIMSALGTGASTESKGG